MPKVALLGLEQSYCSSLTGLMDLLQIANHHARQQLAEKANLFECRLLSIDGSKIHTASGLQLPAPSIHSDDQNYDVVFVPGVYYPGHHEFSTWLDNQQSCFQWLEHQHQSGAKLAANCTGTFLLASTGLLNRRLGTTTWWLEDQFRRRFPEVDLDVKQMITEDNRLICAGAITSYQQLALLLVGQFQSPQIASLCAKALLVDLGQNIQVPYISLAAKMEHGDKLVSRAQYLLQQRLKTSLTIAELAAELNVSQRTLIRRFKEILGESPLSYLQNLRIEAAKRLLENTTIPVDSILQEVGYSDASSFGRLFQRKTGVSPRVYRHRLALN